MALVTDKLQAALRKAEVLQQCLARLEPGLARFAELAEAVDQLAPALAEWRSAAREAALTLSILEQGMASSPSGSALADVQPAQKEFETILRGLADGVTVLDAQNQLVYINDAAARAAGYASAEHMRQSHTAGTLLDKFELRDAQGQPFPLDQLPNRQQSRHETPSPATLCYRRKGTSEERWAVVGAQSVLDDAGRLRFVVIITHDITDRHLARAALRESQERYRGLFEYAPISLWEEDFSEVQIYLAGLRRQGVTDFDAYLAVHPEAAAEGMRRIRVLDVNEATLQLYGAQSKSELLGQVTRIFGPETYPIIIQELAALARGEHEFAAEGVNYRLSGERLAVAVRWVLPPDQAPPASRVLVSISDITRRQQAELARLASEVRFRTYVEHSPQGVFVIDPAGRYRDANPAACQLVGYPREELLELRLSNLVPPEEIEASRARVGEVMAAGAFSGEVRLKKKDRSVIPVILNAVRLPDGTAMAFCTDIAERKQMEEALRQSEERYRELFNSMTEGFALHEIVCGENGQPCDYRFLDLNPAFEKLTGLKREDLIGARQSQVLPDEDPYWLETYSQVTLTGQSVHLEHYSPPLQRHYEVFAYRPAPSQFAVIFVDITARKQAEEALRTLNAELEQRVADRTAELSEANAALVRAGRMKDEFLATMSHELRTPLTAVQGLSEALQMGLYGPLVEKQLKALSAIRESGQHLLELITDILDLSKLEVGKLELQSDVVAVEDICQASLNFIQPLVQKKHLHVSLTFDTQTTTLHADARRLKQMLVNLLNNAVKFTPAGGEIGLKVEGDLAGQEIRFIVWDTGIGIVPENLSRLFQPFTQLDSRLARDYEGTGLGLALVQRLAKLHGGHVAVESDGVPGHGSTFTLVLPCQGRRSEEVSDQGELTAALDRGAGQLILVVGGNQNALSAITDFLRAQAYRVEVAREGLEALQQAHALHPALILMDIQMPGRDGLEVIRTLRADPNGQIAAIPIVALTALTVPGDRERCLAAGAADYMTKPVKLGELAQTIARQLELMKR